jgi:hypothetical protein
MIQFWVGMDRNNYNSMTNFNKLNDACYGITWHSFELDIFNQATTRKRLLTQGSTTYETIDLESSQNLLVMTDTNATHTPTITWLGEFIPPGHIMKEYDLQTGSFNCTLEEIAPGHTKHFQFIPNNCLHTTYGK